jgi:RNA polymerase subunit RPABC4/transcription elongation factor Spt4
MEQRSFHGNIQPEDLAQALIAAFNQGNLMAQQVGAGDKVMVQIARRRGAQSGGQVSLAVTIQKHEDGVTVAQSEKEWLGVAASLGQSAISTLMNPWNLLNRLDDIAQDVTSLQLSDKVWEIVEKFARTAKATKTISERLRAVACPYCGSANELKTSNCVTCGGPLGDVQPTACPKCGNVMPPNSKFCASCGTALMG